MKAFMRCVTAVALSAGLAACAAVPTDPEDRAEFEAVKDPIEPLNRSIFEFNIAVDKALLKPIAQGYRAAVPDVAQRSVHNALNNLRSPLVFVNDVLQGNPDRATHTLVRFMLNSTAGLFGLFDVVADTGGVRFHGEDFGQTLAVWGVTDGPYLMLPLLGPSSPRDFLGWGVEFFADPTDMFLANHVGDWSNWTRLGVGIVDERTQLLDPLDELERGSLDFYAAIRSVYRQRRAGDIGNKDVSAAEAIRQGSTK